MCILSFSDSEKNVVVLVVVGDALTTLAVAAAAIVFGTISAAMNEGATRNPCLSSLN